jgi:DNA-binding transcriptional LysR family regulator
VGLTRIGRDLLPVFQRMLADLDSVVVDARDLSSQRRGTVRIACLPSIAAGLLPDAIRAFRETRAGVGFVLKDAIASRVLSLVKAEEVDLGVMGGAITEPDIEILFSAEDAMHVVFPADHPLGAVSPVTIDRVAEYPLILMDPETSVRAIVDAAFIAAGRMPSPACEATYMMTAVGMVRAGLGLTILPASAREIRAEPSLRSRAIEGPGFSRALTIIKKAGRSLPPLSKTFVGYLTDAFAP